MHPKIIYYTEDETSFAKNIYMKIPSNESYKITILNHIYNYIENKKYDYNITKKLFDNNKTLEEIMNNNYKDCYFIIQEDKLFKLCKIYQIIGQIINQTTWKVIRFYSYIDENNMQIYGLSNKYRLSDKYRLSNKYKLSNKLYTNLLRENPNLLYFAHPDTTKIIDNLLKESIYNIKYVPYKYLNQDTCNDLFLQDYEMINYIPNNFITQEMYETVSSLDMNFLVKIPDKFLNNIIIINSIKNNFKHIKINIELINNDHWIKYCEIHGIQKLLYANKKIDQKTLKICINNDSCSNDTCKFLSHYKSKLNYEILILI